MKVNLPSPNGTACAICKRPVLANENSGRFFGAWIHLSCDSDGSFAEAQRKKGEQSAKLREAAERLEEIHEELGDLLKEAGTLLAPFEEEGCRARSYWLGAMQEALGSPRRSVGMEDSIDELRKQADKLDGFEVGPEEEE